MGRRLSEWLAAMEATLLSFYDPIFRPSMKREIGKIDRAAQGLKDAAQAELPEGYDLDSAVELLMRGRGR